MAVPYSLRLPTKTEAGLGYENRVAPLLRHPVHAWLGLRAALGQHTAEEHAVFKRWAAGRMSLVEIGVAEGVSALALREEMKPDARLHLIDPFHLSRARVLNFMRRAARRAVGSCPRGEVVWIEKFSHEAAQTWKDAIDLLLIDGDHAETAVEQDWNDWSRFVKPGGVVIFHDARLFEGGWTSGEYGPVRFVDRLFRGRGTAGWAIAEEVHSVLVVEKSR
jgi:hypothetical protein